MDPTRRCNQAIRRAGFQLVDTGARDLRFYDFILKLRILCIQAIAIHTFVVVIWGKLGNNFSFAYCIVALNWLFVIFFVALGLSLNKNSSWAYETPVGVSSSFSYDQ